MSFSLGARFARKRWPEVQLPERCKTPNDPRGFTTPTSLQGGKLWWKKAPMGLPSYDTQKGEAVEDWSDKPKAE